jgi:hypothetical protein
MIYIKRCELEFVLNNAAVKQGSILATELQQVVPKKARQ